MSPDIVALRRRDVLRAALLVPGLALALHAQRATTVTASSGGQSGAATVTVATPLASALHRPPVALAYTDFLHPDTATLRVLASRMDRLTNGDPTLWRADNPNIEQYQYRLFHLVLITGTDTLGPTGVGTFDAWLAAHGYPIESAFLHMKDSTATKAHRITWFLKMSNGDSASALNPADSGFRAYQLSILTDLKSRGYAGVFYDVFGRAGFVRLFNSAEGDSIWYRNALTGALAAERAASGERITLNTSTYMTQFDSLCIVAAGGTHLELSNWPLGYNLSTNFNLWRWIDHLVASGVQRIEFVSNLAWYDKVPANVGNDVTPIGREKMAEYVSYLMAKDTGSVVAFAMDNYWKAKPDTMSEAVWDTSIVNAKNHWLAAWDTSLGRPTGPRVMLTSGTDSAGQKYQIWRRVYQRAVVVMHANAYPTIPANFGDSSAVLVPLGATGRLLRSDGTTAPPDSTVRLRAGEGVVVLTP